MIDLGAARNATDLKHQYFPDVGVETVWTTLWNQGLQPYVQQTKPLLTSQHVKK